jgi:hypothetical protein
MSSQGISHLPPRLGLRAVHGVLLSPQVYVGDLFWTAVSFSGMADSRGLWNQWDLMVGGRLTCSAVVPPLLYLANKSRSCFMELVLPSLHVDILAPRLLQLPSPPLLFYGVGAPLPSC